MVWYVRVPDSDVASQSVLSPRPHFTPTPPHPHCQLCPTHGVKVGNLRAAQDVLQHERRARRVDALAVGVERRASAERDERARRVHERNMRAVDAACNDARTKCGARSRVERLRERAHRVVGVLDVRAAVDVVAVHHLGAHVVSHDTAHAECVVSESDERVERRLAEHDERVFEVAQVDECVGARDVGENRRAVGAPGHNKRAAHVVHNLAHRCSAVRRDDGSGRAEHRGVHLLRRHAELDAEEDQQHEQRDGEAQREDGERAVRVTVRPQREVDAGPCHSARAAARAGRATAAAAARRAR